ncbi:hypothetical protein ACVIJ6_003537 [Bradyrhizobium sp. USDA 4369]
MLSGASAQTTGAPGRERLHRIGDCRQHLIVDDDRFGGFLRGHARGGDDGSDGLTGVADDLMGEQATRRHRHRLAVGPLEDRERRDGADVVGDEIGAGIDRLHARDLARRSGVDRQDFRMRMRRAQHVKPQRAVIRLVVDELPLPGEQPLILQALDGLPRAEPHIVGKNVHSSVLG